MMRERERERERVGLLIYLPSAFVISTFKVYLPLLRCHEQRFPMPFR